MAQGHHPPDAAFAFGDRLSLYLRMTLVTLSLSGRWDVERASHQELETLQPWPVIAVRLSGSSAHETTSYPFGCEPRL